MLRGDRGKRTKAGLVFGIVFAAVVSAIIISWGLSESFKYQWQADYKTAEYAKHTGDKVAKACVGIPRVEKFNCLSDAVDAQRAYERDEYDLVAQRQSALWAFIMAAAAVIGMGLSVIGVYLVWTTFAETRKANEIAKDAMIADNRAWVRLDFKHRQLWMSRDQITMDIIIHPENAGHSVALDVRCWGELYIGHTGEMMNERFFRRQSPQFYQTQQAHNIWPGQEGAAISRTVHGLSICNNSVPTEKYRIFLILVASYRTIFDQVGDPPKISELIQEITKVDGSAFDVETDSALPANHSVGIDVGFIHSNIGSGRIT